VNSLRNDIDNSEFLTFVRVSSSKSLLAPWALMSIKPSRPENAVCLDVEIGFAGQSALPMDESA
jgi:hypothetical protein